jgi:DNA-binding MarR family transcriptional regulator
MMKLELSELVPFLLNRAGSRVAATFSKVLREHDLTLPMWRILAAIHEHRSLRAGHLATVTSLEPWTVSRLLGALASRGLIHREHESEDARAVTVHLTAEGRQLTERIIPEALRCEKVTLEGFDSHEVALLKDMLRRLYENMDRLENEIVRTAEEDFAQS